MRSLFFAPVLASAYDIFSGDQPTCAASGFEHDTDYHTGQDLGSVDASDENDCCHKCSGTTACNYFTFVGGECWLKKGRSGVRKVSGAISGGVLPIPAPPPPPPPTPPPTPPAPPAPPPPVTSPVQVFLLLGQSNMLGEGEIEKWEDGGLEYATVEKGLYPYLHDQSGSWSVRDHVRDVFIMGSADAAYEDSKLQHNEWLTVNPHTQSTIGPELGIGFTLANYTADTPVMMLKSCIGNRALGWDLLPPGSKQWEYTDSKGVTWVHAGYHDSPDKWQKGTQPKPISWKAGIQYDGDIARAKHVLADLDTHYPGGATSYEVAGFFWWQGDKDSRSELADRYEFNLVNFIKQLRTDFNAPNAKFVTASLGQTEMGAKDGGGKILDAMLAVDGTSGKYPEFAGNVAAVYTHPLSRGGSSGAHYNKNAETYMNVGEAMGAAMVDLLKGGSSASIV